MLVVEHVSKGFDGRPVLVDVNLEVRPGECHCLCGPNGSGKTTLLAVMSGLVRPTTGRVLWNGIPVQLRSVRRQLGVVFQEALVWADLTPDENLRMQARLHSLSNPAEVARAWLFRAGIRGVSRPAKWLSKGMRQRLALARAMLHDPLLLLLDEPYDGLDDTGVAWLDRELGAALARGAAVVVTAPRLLSSVGIPVHRVWTLRRGRLVAAS